MKTVESNEKRAGGRGVEYVDVILPLKLKSSFTYIVPDSLAAEVGPGSWVVATVVGRRYLGVVKSFADAPVGVDPSKVKPIEGVEDLPKVKPEEMRFWEMIADYYLCTVGEVFKCAYPASFFKQVEKNTRARKGGNGARVQPMPQLSGPQEVAREQIKAAFAAGKPALLNGVTGSGKTELYITLARETLAQNKSVLYLVPEITLSRQLEKRLEAHFGESLFIWHSRKTSASRKHIFDAIKDAEKPCIVLGTRSAVFLPFSELGLIVIDEEHDSSYKQEDPAPRYNGRDSAMMLASHRKADVVLGSATPSLESLYNCKVGKYVQVRLQQRYYGSADPEIEVVDMNKVYRLHNTEGSFSVKLANQIRSTVGRGGQVMVFRSRRAYSSYLQCDSCGEVAKCPNCNISLSYHRTDGTLECHYCGYKSKFSDLCPNCGEGRILPKGAGTEKIEEELSKLLPEARVARLDADVTAGKRAEAAVLKEFEKGEADILVGTQMISKGFDFGNVSLVAVLSADSLFCQQDFRADEKARQLLLQLRGRGGRREEPAKFVIQTCQPDHQVLASIVSDSAEEEEKMLEERRKYGFPPYVRMVTIDVRDIYEGRMWRATRLLESQLRSAGLSFAGPMRPIVDKKMGQFISIFWIKLSRDSRQRAHKRTIAECVEKCRIDFPSTDIVIDVDPL